jgi:hypothetical protein
MPAGRPSDYTLETATLICERIADGEGLVAVCDSDDMPARSTVYLWLNEHKEFSDMYARAVDLRVERWGEEILDISDDAGGDAAVRADGTAYIDGEAIGRARLRIDTRKWLMSKLLPRKYGDKLGLVGGDGEGPVRTEDVSKSEFARRVAFLLASGVHDNT